MDNSFIDRLYNIVINNDIEEFKKSIKDFDDFSRNLNDYVKLDDRVFSIIMFLIDKGKYFEFPYVVSRLFDYLNSYQNLICFNICSTGDGTLDDLDVIINELKRFNEVKEYVSSLGEDFLDSLNKESARRYFNSIFYIQYLDALTAIISKNFLEIPRSTINYILDLIYSNDYLKDFISGKCKNSMMTRDFIIKYFNRIIPIELFLGNSDIDKDIIVRSIIDGKIKDKKLVFSLFNMLSPNKILYLFNSDINSVIEFILSLDYLNDVDKGSLLINIMDKLIKVDEYNILFEILSGRFIDDRLISLIVNDKYKSKIINGVIYFDEDYLKYVLDNGLRYDSSFMINLSSLYRGSKYYDIFLKRYLDNNGVNTSLSMDSISGKILDMGRCISYLGDYFNDKISLNEEEIMIIIRSIMVNYLDSIGISDVPILFGDANSFNGCYNNCEDNKYIIISSYLIKLLLSKRIDMKDRLRIFITMFHEMRHARQYYNLENDLYDSETYFMLKEDIMIDGDLDYYFSNYFMVLKEIDARKYGYLDAFSFLSSNFPFLNDDLNSIDKEKEYSYSDYSSKTFSISEGEVNFDYVFDRIILMNPLLLDKYPILNIEYNKDGSVKSYEELNSSSDNSIVRDIIVNRYGGTRNGVLV